MCLRYCPHRYLYIFLIFIVLSGSWHHTASAQDLVPDPKLAELIRSTLWLADDHDITVADLDDLTTLRGFNKGITNLTGLEHAINLTSVNFLRNQISDISPLSSLTTKLSKVNLSDNQISDISPLENLEGISELNLSDNQISDISPLENLSELEKLYLRGNPIRDFRYLSGLTSLTTLGVEETSFSDSDITLLRELENLEALILAKTQIRNITDLATVLTKTNALESLNLSGNQLTDINPLSSLVNPTELLNLTLNDNQISNLSPLEGFTSLHTLYLDNNRITDVTPLGKLINLQWRLHIRNNQISDISPLRTLTMLQRLYMEKNQVSDLTPLKFLTSLTTLEICYNPYTDITPLASLPNLSRLEIDEEFRDDPAISEVGRVILCSPLPDPPPELESEIDTETEAVVKRRKYITQCGLGWTPQSQYQHWGELPKVMIYALEFEYDSERHGRYICKTIEIRTGDDSIENLAGWHLYLGTLYNPSISPMTIPEEHSQITDRILRITPDMLGLETFPCNTVNGISHPLPGVSYVLKTDENILVDTAYSCFLWGQIAYTTVNGKNVESQRRISSAALREMELPRLERYITNNIGVFITYMDIEAFTWDRVVLSDWLLPPSESSAPGAPSALQRKLVTTWGALKK